MALQLVKTLKSNPLQCHNITKDIKKRRTQEVDIPG